MRPRRGLLAELRRCGALFVTSAVESLSDRVLARLARGTARGRWPRAFELWPPAPASRSGPSLVPFTPWEHARRSASTCSTPSRRAGWPPHLDPVQLTIRLLVPPGSLLEGAGDIAASRGSTERALTWRWRHPDPRMDALQREVAAAAEEGERRRASRRRRPGPDPARSRALAAVARPTATTRAAPDQRARGPRLTEQLVLLSGAHRAPVWQPTVTGRSAPPRP